MTGRHEARQGKVNGWKKEASGKRQTANPTWKMGICLLMFAWLVNSAAAQAPGYVKEWLILGAFPARAYNALLTDGIGGEAALRPHGGLTTAGQIWRHYQSAGANELNFLDPVLDFSPIERAVAYAHIYVHSPQVDTLQLLTGFDEQLAIWVNGQLVRQRAERHNFQFDDDTALVALQKGWNSVLFKVVNQLEIGRAHV